MPNMLISINYRRPIGPFHWTQVEGVRSLQKWLAGVLSGHVEADDMKFLYNDSIAPNSSASYAGSAAALLVASSASGAVGGTIAGTAVTVTAAGGDIATMSALAAAIRANASINRVVTANNKCAAMTCTSVVAGTTVEIWNTKFTALANGVTPTDFAQFSVGASDTAAGTNLALAINQHPSLTGRITAVSSAGLVVIAKVDSTTNPLALEGIRNPSAATIAISAPLPVASARCMIFASVPGTIGNEVRAAASGTGMSIATNGAAGLMGGGSGGGIPAFTSDVVL